MHQPHLDRTDIEQFNLGSHIRNAARDYLEIHKASTARQLIETSVMDELDSLSAENESVFRRRFGFDARQAVRQDVLAIKHQYESPRVSRRLLNLRRWSHEEINEVLPRSPRARRAHGARASR